MHFRLLLSRPHKLTMHHMSLLKRYARDEFFSDFDAVFFVGRPLHPSMTTKHLGSSNFSSSHLKIGPYGGKPEIFLAEI